MADHDLTERPTVGDPTVTGDETVERAARALSEHRVYPGPEGGWTCTGCDWHSWDISEHSAHQVRVVAARLIVDRLAALSAPPTDPEALVEEVAGLIAEYIGGDDTNPVEALPADRLAARIIVRRVLAASAPPGDQTADCPTIGVCPNCREGYGHWHDGAYEMTAQSAAAVERQVAALLDRPVRP